MESNVTRLLVTIKKLLEGLTEWSLGNLTDMQVSDLYVQWGNDFNAAVAAFDTFGIDMRYAVILLATPPRHPSCNSYYFHY